MKSSLFKRADSICREMFEEYRPISGFEDYEISQEGIVRRKFKDGHYHYIFPYDDLGVKVVYLFKYGKIYHELVDRLIDNTFFPNVDFSKFDNEEFRPIPGFKYYEINRDGIVRREEDYDYFISGSYQYFSPFNDGNGYRVVDLYIDEKKYRKSVDSLVNSVFPPNEDPYQFENFRPIPDFEIYEISRDGIIRRRLKNGSYRYISSYDNGLGYREVNLYMDGKVYKRYVHRLVAITYLPNDDPDRKKEINHINENKSDNRLENLEWCTRSYNLNYGTRNERASQARRNTLKNRNKTNSEIPQNSAEKG